jgi:hypothetical protein
MKNNKLQILYTIKGIQPYHAAERHVAILLSPVDRIEEEAIKNNPNMNVGMIGPDHEGIPPEVKEQLASLFSAMAGGRNKHEDDRNIVLIESEIEFQKRNWRYGDAITATFEKIE